MTRSTLGQSLIPALNTWEELAGDGPTGPGIDFSETNRTRLCCTRFEEFLENPSVQSFRKLWSDQTLTDYWSPSPAVLLGPDNAIEQLQTVLSEMSSADEFDPSWIDNLGGIGTGWGIYELYGRLQGGHEPIPSTDAQSVLNDLGYDVENDPNAVVDSIPEFREMYDTHVGHASQGTPYEIPVYAEIDEFFELVETADRDLINAQLTGTYASLFRPLIGYGIHTETSESFRWTGVDELIEDHVEARDSGAYGEDGDTHWGGGHVESWKWQFRDYFQEVVWSEFDLTELDAEDVPNLFNMIQEPAAEFDVVSNVPAKMMGGSVSPTYLGGYRRILPRESRGGSGRIERPLG